MKSLNIIEIFASVQGETHLSGLPTTFVRLAACNLRCTWCDTPYGFGRGESVDFTDIFEKVEEFGCKHVCVTGGEPLLQKNVFPLISTLCDQGYVVSVETGGSLPTTPIDPRAQTILDIKCPGSGMEKKNLLSNFETLRNNTCVKFVLLDRQDYDFAHSICQKYRLFEREQRVLLSPVHGELDPKELVGWILQDKIPVRLNLQIHKYIWSPETKGV